MKRKYTRGDEEITGAPESRRQAAVGEKRDVWRQERAQRHRHQQLAAIAKSSLLKIKSKNEPRWPRFTLDRCAISSKLESRSMHKYVYFNEFLDVSSPPRGDFKPV